MRKLLLITPLLFFCFQLFADKDLPKFGNIDKSDLELKECDFDKDADAYKLISYRYVHFDIIADHFTVVAENRIRIKILKDKGLDEANIKIRFLNHNNFENINGISGYTYNLDNSGEVEKTKLEKSSIYIKKLNNRYSEVSFTMPNVKVGSVFEYKFNDLQRSIQYIDDWYFQEDIPTRISKYCILYPSIFRFTTQLLAYQKVDQNTQVVNDNLYYHGNMVSNHSEEKTYILRDVAALADEPFMRAERDYLQRVVSQLSMIQYPNGEVDNFMSSWPKLTTELLDDEDFGGQLKKNLPHTQSLDEQLKSATDDYHKMILIHDFVRNNMNWDGRETIYSTQGIKSAWDKKSGSNSELNFILIDLLRDAGLRAFPLLVSTKDNGTVNTMYPFLGQFNCTMTCVLIGEQKYILNAADKYNPAYLIPYDVLDNYGFVVDKEYGGWINLSDPKDKWKNMVSIFATIDSNNVMEGNASVYSYGYAKNPREKDWIENKSTFEDRFTDAVAGMKVRNLEVTNENADSLPLQQKFEFKAPLNSSGDYTYFSLNLFQGLEKNPFIADERKTDIDFNFPKSYIIVGKINIPDGYEFEGLPKSIKMITPDTSIVMQRILQPEPNAIDFRITLDFTRSVYAASDYGFFHEFYKQLFNKLNEQIVIKKKTNS
ncbi:MAG: DUF3857 domain-containing protein [Ginsengibacter sp.]